MAHAEPLLLATTVLSKWKSEEQEKNIRGKKNLCVLVISSNNNSNSSTLVATLRESNKNFFVHKLFSLFCCKMVKMN